MIPIRYRVYIFFVTIGTILLCGLAGWGIGVLLQAPKAGFIGGVVVSLFPVQIVLIALMKKIGKELEVREIHSSKP